MKPILSICILTYNRIATLRETLDSVIPQVNGNRDVEILVSDNASNDGTKSLIADYMACYPCIRYNRNPENLGFDGNVIVCVEQGHGEYINFFSDDDIALPGTFERILEEIRIHSPAIIYANHYGFDDNPLKIARTTDLPKKDMIFLNGKEFFLFCTGGFISALTLKASYAKKYIPYVKNNGRGYAHINFTARIALNEKGPFRFVGSLFIAARRPPGRHHDWLTYAGINEAIFFQELYSEGLIDSQSQKKFLNRHIIKTIIPLVLVKKCLGDHKHLEAQKELIFSTFKGYLSFYLFVYPLLLMPRSILRIPYLILRSIIQISRNIILKFDSKEI